MLECQWPLYNAYYRGYSHPLSTIGSRVGWIYFSLGKFELVPRDKPISRLLHNCIMRKSRNSLKLSKGAASWFSKKNKMNRYWTYTFFFLIKFTY